MPYPATTKMITTTTTTAMPVKAPTEIVERSTTLTDVGVLLTAALDVDGKLDPNTIARLRDAVHKQCQQYFDTAGMYQWSFLLDADSTPPRQLQAAAFSVRLPWSQWFKALSPTGKTVSVTVVDDRRKQKHVMFQAAAVAARDGAATPAATTAAAAAVPTQHRAPSPVSSLGRSSSCSSVRSAASVSTAPTSIHSSSNCSPTMPLTDLANLSLGEGRLGNGVLPVHDAAAQAQRRVRRQRGGVKQKQRGIHVDKSKLEVTPFDNGITGVLTGGVMLGRRPRPAAPTTTAPSPAFGILPLHAAASA